MGKVFNVYQRKICWEQANDILKREDYKIKLQNNPKNNFMTKIDIAQKVAIDIPAISLTDKASAASLNLKLEELPNLKKQVGIKKASGGMFGFKRKQHKKNSTWFTI